MPEANNDYDAETKTVLMDDGSRESVFSIDDCPICGGHLCTVHGDGLDQALCLADACSFYVDREAAS